MGSSAQDKSNMAKADPNEIKTIIVRVPGGEVPPVPALAPKVGPMKLSPKSEGEDLCKATKDWKGMNVTCKLHVLNRKVTVEVVPSATAMVIKALKEPPRDRKKVKNISHDGNITWDDILSAARVMKDRSMAKDLSGVCRELLGTAHSIGCTVDNEHPHDLIEKIRAGEFEVPEE